MKILYLIKNDTDETVKRLMAEQKKQHDIFAIDLRNEKQYAKVVQMIVEADHVISW